MCWCQQFLPHVKGPLFLTLGLDALLASRPVCGWEQNSPSLSFSRSLSVLVFLPLPYSVESRKQNEWVGTRMHHLSPARSTQPEVTEAWPPTTGLIVEILRLAHIQKERGSELVHFFMLKIVILLQVRCSHSNFGSQFLYFFWLILKYSLKKTYHGQIKSHYV